MVYLKVTFLIQLRNIWKDFSDHKKKVSLIILIILLFHDFDIICDIIFIDEWIEYYKLRCRYLHNIDSDNSDDSDDYDYDYYYGDFSVSLVDASLFPGFKEFHNIFKKIIDQLNYIRYDCESDSEIEIEIESESESDSEWVKYF